MNTITFTKLLNMIGKDIELKRTRLNPEKAFKTKTEAYFAGKENTLAKIRLLTQKAKA